MFEQEDESLEEYLEKFLYNLQKSKQHSLNPDAIRTFFLEGIRDEYLDILNVMGKGYLSYLPFDEIAELCQKYSRGRPETRKRDITSRASKSTIGGVIKVEIGSLLEKIKTDILSTLGTQVDVLKSNKNNNKKKKHCQSFLLSVGRSIFYENVLWIIYMFVNFVEKIMLQMIVQH